MKYKVIDIPNKGKVVVDESAEIKDGDKLGRNKEPFIITSQKGWNNTIDLGYRVIVATINFSISLNVPMVVIEDEIKRLADEYSKSFIDAHGTEEVDFIEGYKAAQQKGVYSEEDLINAAKYGYEFRDTTSFPEHKFEDSCINNFKQHLQSIKQEYIELEMEKIFSGIISGGFRTDEDFGGKGLTHHTQKVIKTNIVDGQLMTYLKNEVK